MANIAPFRAALPDLTDIISFDDFFGHAKRKFPLYLADGLYEQISNKAIFIYRIKRSNRSHTGIIACTNVLDYIHGKIKKHEHTLSSKEEKMMRLYEERDALIKPILLTYPNVLHIDAFLNRFTVTHSPSFSIPFQDEEHIFWEINDESNIFELVSSFKKYVPISYICDGHHRSKTSEKFYHTHKNSNPDHNGTEPYNYMLAGYFAASEIEIHNYNRIVSSLRGLSSEEFLSKVKLYYNIYRSPKAVRPLNKHHLGLFLNKEWYKLILKDEFIPNSKEIGSEKSLDVHLLNKYLFNNVLGIKDVRTEVDLKYIEGPKGTFSLERRVREDRGCAAFNMFPITLEELIAVSNDNGSLPPKSTWVEPRMRNGFITQLYTNL